MELLSQNDSIIILNNLDSNIYIYSIKNGDIIGYTEASAYEGICVIKDSNTIIYDTTDTIGTFYLFKEIVKIEDMIDHKNLHVIIFPVQESTQENT